VFIHVTLNIGSKFCEGTRHHFVRVTSLCNDKCYLKQSSVKITSATAARLLSCVTQHEAAARCRKTALPPAHASLPCPGLNYDPAVCA